MIIADENVDRVLIDQMRANGYEVFSIREDQPGISDKNVIQLAKSKKALIITEDKDFGELVFAHEIKNCSVIFLRYEKRNYEKIVNNVFQVLKEHYQNSGHYFITITSKQVRIRSL